MVVRFSLHEVLSQSMEDAYHPLHVESAVFVNLNILSQSQIVCFCFCGSTDGLNCCYGQVHYYDRAFGCKFFQLLLNLFNVASWVNFFIAVLSQIF